MDLTLIKNNTVKKILEFSIPSIIAMLLTSLITIADGYFVGNYVGKEGLAAINLGLPVLYFYLAVGLMLSVGGIAISGMALGAGELKKCKEVFNQTILTTLVMTIFISVVEFFLFTPLMQLLHVNEEVGRYFVDYYKIMLFTFPLMVLNSAFGMFIRGEGAPQFVMLINIGNVILNIVLDALFVKIFDFGIRGIAAASLISVIIGTLVSILFFVKKAKVYRFGKFRFSVDVLKDTVLNGGSEFIGEMSMCISMYMYNWIIMREVGVDGVAAFTIVGYLSYVFSMIVIGFGQGLSPLVSFAYGAGETMLAVKIRKQTNRFVFAVGVVAAVILLFTGNMYANLFGNNGTVNEMAGSGIRIFVISFLFSGINTICSMYFTSIGRAKESAVISAARGLVILLICIFTLPPLLGMTGVWLVAPVTELLTVLISGYFILKSKNVLIRS